MVIDSAGIYVKSHTARDLLQSAGLFKTDKLVVWEYVSNSLQYVDPGASPIVRVTLDSKNKRIVVADNGRGMDWAGLENFFVMHGENLDRRVGRPGRGRFGTGKSAAFGIADKLRITTSRNKRRSIVELTRRDIEAMNSGDPVPVKTVAREVFADQPNGTIVEIEGIHLKALDQAGIIRYIERHLARWPRNATAFVNNHECEFVEPPVSEVRKFTPAPEDKRILGDVELVVKIAKSPLEEDLRGVSIFSKGVWYETTLAGSEGRDMAQYIFGEMDVPKLDEDKSPIPPMDISRSMQLNPSNEIVRTLYSFIGQKVEEVRRNLVERDKQRRATEEAKRLAKEAAEIAKIINDDFDAFRQRVAKAKAAASGGADLRIAPAGGGQNDEDLIPGSSIPGEVVSPTGGPGAKGTEGGGGVRPRNLGPQVAAAPSSAEKVARPAGGSGDRPKPSGGFQVKFENMGLESHRAQYVRDERTIYINLEHPQIAAARGISSAEDPVFRRLAYEVAFSEYAVALASELAARDEYLDLTDPIVDIRETLNRVARKAAALYSTR